jgi:integrase/recombinase XerD
MDAMIQEFSLALAAEGKRAKTIKIYTEAAAWLQRTQGLADWSEVKRSHVRAHLAHILEGHSDSYANQQYRSLRRFFAFLEEDEGITNPMANVKPPRVAEKLVPLVSDSEWRALVGTCSGKTFLDIRDKAIFEMFRATGARLAEVTNLKVTDVDIDLLSAIVTGKNGKMRIVRFDAACALALARYLRIRKNHKHGSSSMLWVGVDGPLHSNAVYLMFRSRGEKAGAKIHPHQFRHTLAHKWLANDGQEGDLMQQTGWSSREMLRRYGASAAAERARAHYDAVMSKKPKKRGR